MTAAHARYTHVVVVSRGEWSEPSLPRPLWKSVVSPALSSLSFSPLWNLARGDSLRDRVSTWIGHDSEERVPEKRGKKIDRRVSPPVEHRYGSPMLRNHRDRVPGLRGSGPPRRRPGSAESSADRRALRAQQLILRVRPEGHFAAHAQDRRRVDVRGKRLFPIHVEIYACISRSAGGSRDWIELFRETSTRHSVNLAG